jgi:DNA (cytosine-5)-methyltransferase 1
VAPEVIRFAFFRLPEGLQDAWVWWNVPAPSEAVPSLGSLIEDQPTGVEWHTKAQTDHVIGLMSPLHLQKLKKAQFLGKRIVGTVYRRTRPNDEGVNAQRAEIRFDQISGCLKTRWAVPAVRRLLLKDAGADHGCYRHEERHD